MKQLCTAENPAQPLVHSVLSADEEVQGVVQEDTIRKSGGETDLAAVHSEVGRSARGHRRLVSLTVFGLMLFVLVFTFAMIPLMRYLGDYTYFWNVDFPMLVNILLGSLLAIGGTMLHKSRKANRGMRRQADILAGSDSVQSVGALIDLFQFDDLAIHRKARYKLTQILPKLRANHAPLLSRQHRVYLNRVLAANPTDVGNKDIRELFEPTVEREVQFREAILKAYEQVGDEEALPIVERLSIGPFRTEAEVRVQAAAKECLPYLKIRVQQQTAHNSLLRASAPIAASGKTLLRPAASKAEAPPLELLRPLDSA